MTRYTVTTFSKGLKRLPNLRQFLETDNIYWLPPFLYKKQAHQQSEIVIGWGQKANTQRARQYAKHNQLPYLNLEDGFLRSVGLGVNKSPPLSLLVDPIGIYYDATRPSLLEILLNGDNVDLPELPVFDKLQQLIKETAGDPLNSPQLLNRARHCIQQIIEHKLSKYNSSPEIGLGPTDKKRILLIDQTAGDMSIQHGLANADSFQQMLDTALDDHPEAEILIKIHPDVLAGKKQAHLLHAKQYPQVRLLSEDINPICLLQQVDEVYVVTSQMGFEALLLGKPVTCFGVPFYGGWGLTKDHIHIPRRKRQRTIEQVFAAAYILYARYLDPDTDEPCQIEQVIEHLALQRHWFKENSGNLYCYGFTLWKRGYVRAYLQSPWNNIQFILSAKALNNATADKNARLLIWGAQEKTSLRDYAKQHSIPIWRMEDGFLRSVGLGSDFTAPASLVVDKRGIYFDPNQQSDLEYILQHHEFTDEELRRAEQIKQAILTSRLSKYNVGQNQTLQHQAKTSQRVILVPGQVEDDASIRLGCREIRTNAQLLHAVRENCPDAYIIYKPHPDVLSGNRKALKLHQHHHDYDQLATDITLHQCLDAVDEVHTMTSLVGYEALLRGKKVATYGLPFYAGWGLSNDQYKIDRRTRKLTVNELIAACMIIYPRYLGHQQIDFIKPEFAIQKLTQSVHSESHIAITAPYFYRLFWKAINAVKGVFYTR